MDEPWKVKAKEPTVVKEASQKRSGRPHDFIICNVHKTEIRRGRKYGGNEK